jgi:hypothetical protein
VDRASGTEGTEHLTGPVQEARSGQDSRIRDGVHGRDVSQRH